MSLKGQRIINWDVNRVSIAMLIKGINEHSTADAFIMHKFSTLQSLLHTFLPYCHTLFPGVW